MRFALAFLVATLAAAAAPTDLDLRDELARVHPQAYAWAVRCCRDGRAEAEDVLHEAYVRVLDGRARFDGGSAFRTWLFAVIRRTAAARRRGVIRPGDEVVALLTGNGLKTPDARSLGHGDGVARPGQPGLAPAIRPSLSASCVAPVRIS